MGNGFFWNGGFELVFSIMFILFVVLLCGSLIYHFSMWIKNNNSPRIVAYAKIVAKSVKYSRHSNKKFSDGYSTYFITFEFESRDRLELKVDSHEYGLLAEGDCGKLSFQGTRYLGFERED